MRAILLTFVLALAAQGSPLGDAMAQSSAPASTPTLKVQPPDLPKDLDGLFAALKRERDGKAAERITARILRQWNRSGDASVDLLAGWAGRAMGKRKYAIALDLLDQVVVLAPDYPEGWNRRATLHFQRKDYVKSLADIEHVLTLEPRHFGALAGMATILMQMDRKPQALQVWYRALAVYPAMVSAQKAVAALEEELAGRGI